MQQHTRANGQGIDLMRNAPIDSQTNCLAGRWTPDFALFALVSGGRGCRDGEKAQAVYNFIQTQVFPAPFSLVLDCHSGFGLHDRIWFPYAKSRQEPIKHLGIVYRLRKLFLKLTLTRIIVLNHRRCII